MRRSNPSRSSTLLKVTPVIHLVNSQPPTGCHSRNFCAKATTIGARLTSSTRVVMVLTSHRARQTKPLELWVLGNPRRRSTKNRRRVGTPTQEVEPSSVLARYSSDGQGHFRGSPLPTGITCAKWSFLRPRWRVSQSWCLPRRQSLANKQTSMGELRHW